MARLAVGDRVRVQYRPPWGDLVKTMVKISEVLMEDDNEDEPTIPVYLLEGEGFGGRYMQGEAPFADRFYKIPKEIGCPFFTRV